MTTVRWGILGTARHAANTWIPALKGAPSASLNAVASRAEAQAQKFAAEHNIPTAYSSYDALLSDPVIDAVYIPLPNHAHKEWAIRVAEAGKHCLCEKPLALNAAEAEAMAAAFRAAGRKLSEAFQWRHHPQSERVRALVQSGAIGTLRLIEAGFSFMLERPDDVRWDPALGGGALYDVGCYPIALMRYVTGAEPLSVTAQAEWHNGIDTLLVATLTFPNNVYAHLNCAFTLPLRRYYEVCGTEGSLAVNGAYNPTGVRDDLIERRGPDREVIEQIDLGRHNSYSLMIEEFSRAILEDREPLFPAEDGVKNMRVIDAIYRAARDGGTVKVG